MGPHAAFLYNAVTFDLGTILTGFVDVDAPLGDEPVRFPHHPDAAMANEERTVDDRSDP